MKPPPLEIEITKAQDGGPLTKQISCPPTARLMKDGSACIMTHGTAGRVRLVDVAALAAFDRRSNAVAGGSRSAHLRTDLPDRVEVTTKKTLMNGAARPDIIARTGSNIIHNGPAFALLDYDSKGISPTVAAELEAHQQESGGALLTVLPALKDTARGDAALDRRGTIACRHR